MTTDSVPAVRGPGASPAPDGPRITLWLLRGTTALLLVAVLAQPVLAGMYLAGQWDALGVHSGNAVLVELLGYTLALVGLVFWLGGRGRGRYALAAVVLWFAISAQAGFGYARLLALHIPLGVTVVTGAVLFTLWVFRGSARIPRRSWRRPR